MLDSALRALFPYIQFTVDEEFELKKFVVVVVVHEFAIIWDTWDQSAMKYQ